MVVLQSESVGYIETYGYFTPCFAGSLIGKMGTHPYSNPWKFWNCCFPMLSHLQFSGDFFRDRYLSKKLVQEF